MHTAARENEVELVSTLLYEFEHLHFDHVYILQFQIAYRFPNECVHGRIFFNDGA
jgi:hypothetical protein